MIHPQYGEKTDEVAIEMDDAVRDVRDAWAGACKRLDTLRIRLRGAIADERWTLADEIEREIPGAEKTVKRAAEKFRSVRDAWVTSSVAATMALPDDDPRGSRLTGYEIVEAYRQSLDEQGRAGPASVSVAETARQHSLECYAACVDGDHR